MINKIIFCCAVLSAYFTNAQRNIFAKDSVQMLKDFYISMPVLPQLPGFKKDTINIQDAGAIQGGVALNTNVINNAIEKLSKHGGGVVLIPGGVWLSGPISLLSNINLHLDRDALLIFTKDKSQYSLIKTEWEGKPAIRNQSPISAENAENIAITGSGIIDGNGQVWRSVKKDKLTEDQWNTLVKSGGVLSDNGKTWFPSESFIKGANTPDVSDIVEGKSLKDYESVKDFYRPNLLVLKNCNKILLENTTFENSPAWCLHTVGCNNLSVKNIYVKNPEYAQNGDGIDIESCKNVLVESSTFTCGDDGICIKSGRDEYGRKRGIPTQNAIIRGNVVYHAHGGFVIGSEMSGGAHNIYVYDNSFIGTDNGLRFKTVRGRGGVVDNIYISNIFMKDILGDAILFDMYYFAEPPEEKDIPPLPVNETTPVFQHFKLKNINCIGANRGIFMRGIPEMNVKDIELSDISLSTKKGIIITEASDINLKNVQLYSSDTAAIDLNNVNNIVFDSLRIPSEVPYILSVRGMKTKDIYLKHLQTDKTKQQILIAHEVNKSAIHIQE